MCTTFAEPHWLIKPGTRFKCFSKKSSNFINVNLLNKKLAWRKLLGKRNPITFCTSFSSITNVRMPSGNFGKYVLFPNPLEEISKHNKVFGKPSYSRLSNSIPLQDKSKNWMFLGTGMLSMHCNILHRSERVCNISGKQKRCISLFSNRFHERSNRFNPAGNLILFVAFFNEFSIREIEWLRLISTKFTSWGKNLRSCNLLSCKTLNSKYFNCCAWRLIKKKILLSTEARMRRLGRNENRCARTARAFRCSTESGTIRCSQYVPSTSRYTSDPGRRPTLRRAQDILKRFRLSGSKSCCVDRSEEQKCKHRSTKNLGKTNGIGDKCAPDILSTDRSGGKET